MTPLCSIVCPSRQRPELLRRMIESVVSTAIDPSRIEIIVRLHSDDGASLSYIPNLLKSGPVRIVIGHPLRGYIDLSRFYEEALALAKGRWVWIQNDDVISESRGWDEALAAESPDHIVMPQIHRLGGSTYREDVQCPFMWIPNHCWEQYTNGAPLATPFDSGMWQLLRRNGWRTSFLDGISVHHQRAVDAELDRERAEQEQEIRV